METTTKEDIDLEYRIFAAEGDKDHLLYSEDSKVRRHRNFHALCSPLHHNVIHFIERSARGSIHTWFPVF